MTTPTLDKIQAVREQSQIIGEFLDYMEQRDVVMAEMSPSKADKIIKLWNGK